MGGGVEVVEFPYNYDYRRYPFGARRVPVYRSSFPEFWSDDRGSSYCDNSVYGGHAVPMFVPFKGDADSFVRKRKLDGLKGEEIFSGGRNVSRNLPVGNGSMANEGTLPSKPKHSPTVNSSDHATTPAHSSQSAQANATNSRLPSPSNLVRNAAQPRVISIPVISTDDEGKDHIVKCTVIPREGTKKLRTAMSGEEAAILVQSRFRGYQVRKTAPLSQLRHIANVEWQLKDFDKKVSDADFINCARESSVAKVKLTEGLMNLLLQLDSIQGAHPFVRATRKVVTKEVIALQGRVDSLLSAEIADTASPELPMEVEGEIRDEVDREEPMATESCSKDSVASISTDSFTEKESDLTECAEPDPDQDKGEVSTDGMEFEACKVDDVESRRVTGSFSIQMVESRPDEGMTQVLREEDNLRPMEMVEADPVEGMTRVVAEEDSLKPMEVEVSKADVSQINERVADEMERIVSQYDPPTESHILEESSLKNESPSDSYHDEDGGKVEGSLVSVERTPQAAEVTTPEAVVVRINTSAERSTPSPRASESFPQERLQSNEEGEKNFDDKSYENGPYSPTSPLEAVDWLNFQPSSSDSEPQYSEPQSELKKSPEIIQGASAHSEADSRALLLKLSEENKVLKSLLVTVMKWNQMQATAMQDVKHRLGKLESRNGNKKSGSRRKAGKSRH